MEKIFSLLLLLLNILMNVVAVEKKFMNMCLHNGCPMSAGLFAEDLDGVITNSLPSEEFKDNVLTFVTYNIQQTDDQDRIEWETKKIELCNYLNKLRPTIFGLQQVKEHQLESLKKCLLNYYSIAIQKNQNNKEPIYDPIFYKKDRRLNLLTSGIFWLSDTPDVAGTKFPGVSEASTCQWARLTFAERLTEYPSALQFGFSSQNDAPAKPSYFSKLLKLLKINTGKIAPPREVAISLNDGGGPIVKQPIMRYRMFDFFVAVSKLNTTNEFTATRQARVMSEYLRNNVMERRQFPMVLMGDLSFQDQSTVYTTLDNKPWFHNTMSSSKLVYPAMSLVHPNTYKESLVDYIWYNRFTSLISATMTDGKEYHRPVFAALLKSFRKKNN